MGQQTLTGRNLRWYFQGSSVGMSRVTQLKPDVTQGLDPVKECGTPDVVEYALKVPETSLTFAYSIISKKQLALAMGQTLSNGSSGEVPDIPTNFDIVERRIQPGTEGLLNGEVVTGYTVYQLCQVEKQSWDQEVDKLIASNLSVKCRHPRDYEGINGIVFDKFTGNGSTTAFVLSQRSIPNKDGTLILRGETPLGTVLKYGSDYTVASTSSTTTVTFTTAPASTTTPNILALYAY